MQKDSIALSINQKFKWESINDIKSSTHYIKRRLNKINGDQWVVGEHRDHHMPMVILSNHLKAAIDKLQEPQPIQVANEEFLIVSNGNSIVTAGYILKLLIDGVLELHKGNQVLDLFSAITILFGEVPSIGSPLEITETLIIEDLINKKEKLSYEEIYTALYLYPPEKLASDISSQNKSILEFVESRSIHKNSQEISQPYISEHDWVLWRKRSIPKGENIGYKAYLNIESEIISRSGLNAVWRIFEESNAAALKLPYHENYLSRCDRIVFYAERKEDLSTIENIGMAILDSQYQSVRIPFTEKSAETQFFSFGVDFRPLSMSWREMICSLLAKIIAQLIHEDDPLPKIQSVAKIALCYYSIEFGNWRYNPEVRAIILGHLSNSIENLPFNA